MERRIIIALILVWLVALGILAAGPVTGGTMELGEHQGYGGYSEAIEKEK